uniref:Ig-like domain-containing protein n=1 Tax=Cyprinodon variegatus TaxID=28743 RepID=A0A3Q2DVC3_CYPVA
KARVPNTSKHSGVEVVTVRSKDGSALETKTAALGDDVTLTCPRIKSEIDAKLFWIRFIPGKWPEILGASTYEIISLLNKYIIAWYNFIYIYIYIYIYIFFIFFPGKESNINAIIQHPFPDVLHPGDSVSLQCSVLFNSQDKSCPTDHMVYWFQTGSDTIYPSFVYAQGNYGDECENSPEDHSERKCFYGLSKNISVSDIGAFYCAVASCGEIMFGNGTKLDIQEPNIWNLQKTNAVFILLCVALAASVVLIFFLTYNLRKKTCHCSNGNIYQYMCHCIKYLFYDLSLKSVWYFNRGCWRPW